MLKASRNHGNGVISYWQASAIGWRPAASSAIGEKYDAVAGSLWREGNINGLKMKAGNDVMYLSLEEKQPENETCDDVKQILLLY